MTVGKELRTIASRSYYANLDEKLKDASDFLFNKIVEKAQEGKFSLTLSYADKDIPDNIFALVEDDNFYAYLKAEDMDALYNPNKGEYNIYWEGA